jgi:hypothetical protein
MHISTLFENKKSTSVSYLIWGRCGIFRGTSAGQAYRSSQALIEDSNSFCKKQMLVIWYFFAESISRLT